MTQCAVQRAWFPVGGSRPASRRGDPVPSLWLRFRLTGARASVRPVLCEEEPASDNVTYLQTLCAEIASDLLHDRSYRPTGIGCASLGFPRSRQLCLTPCKSGSKSRRAARFCHLMCEVDAERSKPTPNA
jgi:hypothetical protein